MILDVVWLAVILKPILNHKQNEDVTNGDIYLHVHETEPIVLTTESQRKSWRKLENQGILDQSLAQTLWPGHLWEYVLPTLEKLDLAFPLPGDKTKMVVMQRLPDRPQAVDETLKDFNKQSHAALKGSWRLIQGAPPGMIEKVLTKCSSVGHTIFWKSGVLVRGNVQGHMGGEFALVVEFIDDTLELQAHGDPASLGPWMALSYVMSAMMSKMLEFPGLRWDASLGCPKHREEELRVSHEVSYLRVMNFVS